jgi:asparagine synthase (glutamine-hydrolysing)
VQTASESALPALLKPHDVTTRLHVDEQIRRTLLNATAARAPKTRPPVVFLSGGFDSSLLVNLLQSIGTDPVAWTASFASHLGERENLRAGAAALHYGISWTQVPVHEQDVREHLPGILDAMREPFADVATLAEAVLACKAAKEHIDAPVFEGEGMDSLMCGSYKFIAERYRGLLAPLLTLLPSRLLGSEDRASRVGSLALKLRQLEEVLKGGAPVDRHVRFLFNESEAMDLMPEIEAKVWDVFKSYYDLLPDADTLTRLACMTFFGIIPNLENRKLHLIERYAGVKFELVYQDIDFVRLAFGLPGRCKVSRGYGKHIVRRTFANHIPEAVKGRAKLSFVFPVVDYFSESELEDLRRTRLGDDDAVRRVIHEHKSGKADHLAFLWGLRVANGWARRYEEAASRASIDRGWDADRT